MRHLTRALLYTLPLAVLGFFFIYPLASILLVSFGEGDSMGMVVLATLQDAYVWRLLWFTTWQAAVSTLLTILCGLPLAFLFARYSFPGKSLLRALTTLPFVMPTVVVAAGFSALLGNSGLINRWLMALFSLNEPPLQLMQTIWIILLAHVFYNVSVIVRSVGGFWANLNPRLEEAAAILGANRQRVFWEVTLPLLLPSIIASGLLVFLFCFTSFGVVLILGGLRFATIEVEIYRQATSLFNLPVAAILSLLQMIISFVVMLFYTRLQRASSLPLELRPLAISQQRAANWRQRFWIGLSLAFMLTMLLAPLLALAIRSFTLGDAGFTIAYYTELSVNRRQSAFFAAPLTAVGNSLWIATATTLISLLLGIISAYLLARPRSWLTTLLDALFLLPLGVSAVTLGFGYIVALGALRTSPLLTPMAHSLIATPFVVRTILPALQRIDPRLREAAAVLGAAPATVRREIDAPLLWQAGLVAAVFAFTISLGEFGATLLVGRPDLPTMPLIIYRALSQPGLLNYGQALAMSTILMVVCSAALVLIERFRLPGEEF
ncbi:MAG: iron ABC transporter permease [Caldilineaceae bacterium]